MLKKYLIFACCIIAMNIACACSQKKSLIITRALVQQLMQLPRDHSNAHDIEKIVGAPAACVPVSNTPSESWVCQWKGDSDSTRITNTMNIFFHAGLITQIVWINKEGDFITK